MAALRWSIRTIWPGFRPRVPQRQRRGVAVELAFPLGLDAPVMERDGLGLAGAHQAGDHAPGGRGADARGQCGAEP